MNAPERFELFVIPEGRKKVAIEMDTKMLNTATYIVEREDHTLGNVLCRQLQQQSSVLFAGYRVPHPLEHSFQLKVQTERTTTPTEALQHGIDTLIGSLSLLEERVKAEVRRLPSTGTMNRNI